MCKACEINYYGPEMYVTTDGKIVVAFGLYPVAQQVAGDNPPS